MAQSRQRRGAEKTTATSRETAALPSRRRQLEETGMRRHIHPLPAVDCCRSGQGQVELSGVVERLERQNELLAELLAAVSGLTAACLACGNREG